MKRVSGDGFISTSAAERHCRLCLAYTDLPGRSLQNDVSLLVQDPKGAKITGNTGLPDSPIPTSITTSR